MRRRLPSAWYVALVAASAGLRLAELRHSRRNEEGVTAAEEASGRYPLMVALHAGLYVLPLLEIVAFRRRPRLPALWVGLHAADVGLRWWCIRSLGASWNVRGAVPRDLAPVTRGPYRFVRHPNYVAVVLEVATLPLAGGAWATAILLSALDGAILWDRVRAEERRLLANDAYREAFADRKRFIPGLF